ncbi:hypothetical protein ONE63_000536 [Megalurothrips usitatus]|uniref:Uncharacterized protein n=1 Tax=Megalurothrips usitatus TaxID=439358 RepID=A0AAV7Y1T9_9NEOP|nr:hypothetical protein ONE63_000536 [Megalurothrips usitatus]
MVRRRPLLLPLLPLLLLQLAAVTCSAREPVRCPPGMHQCVSRKQVKCFVPDAVCDGEMDCTDGSDEEGCTECRPGSLLCGGRCARRCDGVVECGDARDEYPCPHCRAGAVLCERRCVRACSAAVTADCVRRCDGVVSAPTAAAHRASVTAGPRNNLLPPPPQRECADGGDEANCFRCGDAGLPGAASDLSCGRERPPRVLGVPRPFHNVTCGRLCDGIAQCANGWDEEGCGAGPAGPPGPADRWGRS